MKETRTVVTVLGADHTGIVAKVAQTLAENDANIVDIRQNVLDKIFSMTMLVTLDEDKHNFNEVQDALNAAAKDLDVQIKIQREDVFNFMYNV
jgi:ACT domain-containing protein